MLRCERCERVAVADHDAAIEAGWVGWAVDADGEQISKVICIACQDCMEVTEDGFHRERGIRRWRIDVVEVLRTTSDTIIEAYSAEQATRKFEALMESCDLEWSRENGTTDDCELADVCECYD